jgi:hypothetical protein
MYALMSVILHLAQWGIFIDQVIGVRLRLRIFDPHSIQI